MGQFLPSATKLRRLCFYRCLSVHRGGAWSRRGAWSLGVVHGPGWCMVLGGVPGPGGLVFQHALTQTTPGETATAADGTHPTGMHSCD